MPIVDFNQLFNSLLAGVKDVAEENVKEYMQNAITSGTNTLYSMKENLEAWTAQLEAGEIGIEDLEWNLQCAMDTAEMVALKQAGLLQVQVDKFKLALSNLIVQTLQTVIP